MGKICCKCGTNLNTTFWGWINIDGSKYCIDCAKDEVNEENFYNWSAEIYITEWQKSYFYEVDSTIEIGDEVVVKNSSGDEVVGLVKKIFRNSAFDFPLKKARKR